MNRIPDNVLSLVTERRLRHGDSAAYALARRSNIRPFPQDFSAITNRYVRNAVADVVELNLSAFPTKFAMLTMLEAPVHRAEASDFAERQGWARLDEPPT
jgi:hypothetical protein